MNQTVSPGPRTGGVRIPASKAQARRRLSGAALGAQPVALRCDGVSADIAATAQISPTPPSTDPARSSVSRLPRLLERWMTFTPPAAWRVSSLAKRTKMIIRNVPVPGP